MAIRAIGNVASAVGHAPINLIKYTGTWAKTHYVFSIVALGLTAYFVTDNIDSTKEMPPKERYIAILKDTLLKGTLFFTISLVTQKILSFLYRYPLIGMSATFMLGAFAAKKYIESNLPSSLENRLVTAQQADTHEHKDEL